MDPICTEKGSLWAIPKMEKIVFGRNNKSRSSTAFRKFLFYQNIICFDWVMDLFPSWVMFSVKKVSFPAKTAVLVRLETWKIITHNNTLTAWALLVSGFLPGHLPVSPSYMHTHIRVSYTTALFISSHQRERG